MTRRHDIALLRTTYLRGPNFWTYRSALEVWLDLGTLEDFPSNRLPGFNQRLVAWLPALAEHHCGVGQAGGFLQRLEEGTWAGHVLEHVVIELLNLAGMPTGFGQTRETSKRGVYKMVFRARDERVARCALAAGHALVLAAIHDEPFDVAAAVAQVREQLDRSYFGPSTEAIVSAAADRGIPHIRLNDGNLVQLGYGASQRRIWTAETDSTSAIAESIASDKDLTKRLIAACGVPVPEGEVADSPEAAWEIAQEIGLPVAVKPSDGNHGRGVALELRQREDIMAAWAVAQEQGSQVLVERFVPGHEHRLLVVGGKLVAASRGETASIVGDGHSTVAELVDTQLNTDPRRGDNEEYPLNPVLTRTDGAVLLELSRQGLTPDSVPAAGRRVLVQRIGNLGVDCTDHVHPEVAHVAALAARVIGLDIAGIDLVAEDIGRPLADQRGAVVEVNAGPGLLMHLKPAVGTPRPVGRAIVEHLFAEDETGRIPIVGISGSRGTQPVARLVARLLQLGGRHVGLACRDGVFLDGRCIDRGDGSRFDQGHRLLTNRMLNAAVFEHGAESILRDGLPYDRCQVGVVTDLEGAERLAEHDIRDADQLWKVLRTQVDVVLGSGVAVLNGADPRVADMARLCDGEVIYYGADPQTEDLGPLTPPSPQRGEGSSSAATRSPLPAGEHPTVKLPLPSGERAGVRGSRPTAPSRAVFLRDGCVILADGHTEIRLAPLQRLTRALRADSADPAPLLAAIATAWALDIPPDLIVAGIETFDAEPLRPRYEASAA